MNIINKASTNNNRAFISLKNTTEDTTTITAIESKRKWKNVWKCLHFKLRIYTQKTYKYVFFVRLFICFFHWEALSNISCGDAEPHKVWEYVKRGKLIFKRLTFNPLLVFGAFWLIIGWSLFWKHPNWQLIELAWRLYSKWTKTSTL